MLPQLVAFGAMVAVCWFGSRWLKQEFERVDTEMKRVERVLTRVRTAPQLRFDPMTGHYRLLDDFSSSPGFRADGREVVPALRYAAG